MAGFDTSNLYANQENAYEDLTVNQQAAQFQAQQNQASQANIKSSMAGAAGGGGIAALAQTMANQSAQQNAAASASIAQQESANQMATAKGDMALQSSESSDQGYLLCVENPGHYHDSEFCAIKVNKEEVSEWLFDRVRNIKQRTEKLRGE